ARVGIHGTALVAEDLAVAEVRIAHRASWSRQPDRGRGLTGAFLGPILGAAPAFTDLARRGSLPGWTGPTAHRVRLPVQRPTSPRCSRSPASGLHRRAPAASTAGPPSPSG